MTDLIFQKERTVKAKLLISLLSMMLFVQRITEREL